MAILQVGGEAEIREPRAERKRLAAAGRKAESEVECGLVDRLYTAVSVGGMESPLLFFFLPKSAEKETRRQRTSSEVKNISAISSRSRVNNKAVMV